MPEGIALRTMNPTDRVALRGVRLRARITALSCKATLEQTFVNLEPKVIEAVYTFPIPDGAAVCGFEVITGDRVLTGAIEEAEQAVERYEEAISQGHGAFVAEQERADVFTVRVGNLKPRQAATIRLTYICALERVDKTIRASFPTTIAPRYATASGTDPLEAQIDADALNPPHVLSVPYGMNAQIEIDLGRELADQKGDAHVLKTCASPFTVAIASPSHRVAVNSGEDGSAFVSFAGGVAEMDRDFVLTIATKKEQQPTVQLARGKDGESYLAVTMVPEFEVDELADPAPSQTIFVLDCSGSMQGESIAQAAAALELCLRAMMPGDSFNICRFGSTFEMLATEPLLYSQQTMERAIAYARQPADLGGTELLAPLQAILRQPALPGTVRNIILLTDGQVTNEPAILELARQHRAHNRIFSFGIGSASSSYLVKGLARATGGASEFITASERIDDKVLRTFSRLASPPVTDVRIDWDGAEVQTLAELPPIFDGDVLAVFGRCAGRAPRRVTLTCHTPAGPRSWAVDVPRAIEDGGVIATMWARRTIQSLEEVNGVANHRARPAKQSRERELLIRLSKDFNLLCCLTTFIAIEHRSLEERTNGLPELRRVPVKLAAGWGGIAANLVAAAAVPMPTQAPIAKRRSRQLFGRAAAGPQPAAPPPQNSPVAGGDEGTGLLDLCRDSDDDALGAVLDEIKPRTKRSGHEEAPELESSNVAHELKSLLSMQTAEGWISENPDELKDPVSISICRMVTDPESWEIYIEKALKLWGRRTIESSRIVQTVLFVVLLQVRFASMKDVWSRASTKAEQYLSKALGMRKSAIRSFFDDLQFQMEARGAKAVS